LSSYGYAPASAATGKEALLLIIDKGEHYDLLLIDIKMPQMDGISLYQHICRKKPALCRHVIFLTGDTVNPKTNAFLDSIPNHCIIKPFELKEFISTIHTTLTQMECSHAQ